MPSDNIFVMWDTVGLFVMTITVSTYTIFIKVRKSYRVLVMLVCFDDVTPFEIVTTKLLLGRQADLVNPFVVPTTITTSVVPATITPSVVPATITPSDG
jgi:hypothetical protein